MRVDHKPVKTADTVTFRGVVETTDGRVFGPRLRTCNASELMELRSEASNTMATLGWSAAIVAIPTLAFGPIGLLGSLLFLGHCYDESQNNK